MVYIIESHFFIIDVYINVAYCPLFIFEINFLFKGPFP